MPMDVCDQIATPRHEEGRNEASRRKVNGVVEDALVKAWRSVGNEPAQNKGLTVVDFDWDESQALALVLESTRFEIILSV